MMNAAWTQTKKYHLFLCFSLALVASLVFPLQDSDLFFYLRLGHDFFSHFSFPNKDPFLYTFKDWHIDHEWLSYVLYYLSYAMGGYTGVIFFKVLLWLSIFIFFIKKSVEFETSQVLNVTLLTIAAIACSHRFVERASLFSDLMTAFLTFYLLNVKVVRRKFALFLPVLFLFWVNVHPGFVVGLTLLIFYFVFSILDKDRSSASKGWLLAGTLAASFATLANPDFLDGAFYPIKTFFKEDWKLYRFLNFEWMPTFQEPFVSTFEVRALIALMAVTCVLLMRSYLKNSWQVLLHTVYFAIFVYLAFNATRFMTTAGLGFCGINLSLLRLNPIKLRPALEKYTAFCKSALFLALAGTIVSTGYESTSAKRNFRTGVNETIFPVKAVQFMIEHNLNGRIFNEYEWGSYLVWALNQPDRLFIHGHVDDPKLMAYEYQGMSGSLQQFQSTIEKYKIRYFLLDKNRLLAQPTPNITGYLEKLKLIYQDEVAVLFEVKN